MAKIKSEEALKRAADKIYHQYSESRYPKAIAAYQELLAIYPDNVDGWARLSTMQDCAKQYDDAIYSIDKALELDPQNDELWDQKGTLLRSFLSEGQKYAGKRFNSEEEIYREIVITCDKQLITLDPNKRKVGDIFRGSPMTVEQVERYRAYVEAEIGSVLEDKADALLECKEYNAAIETFEKAVELYTKIDKPSNLATCYFWLSYVCEEMGDYEAAIAWNKKLYSAKKDEIALSNRVRLLVKKGDFQHAVSVGDEFISIVLKKFEETKHAAYLFQMCDVYCYLKQYDEALRVLDSAETVANSYSSLSEDIAKNRKEVMKLQNAADKDK